MKQGARRNIVIALSLFAVPVVLPTPATSASASVTVISRPSRDEPPLAKRGDRSSTVRKMQRLLLKAGIPLSGGADGSFGAATEAAVAVYQTRRGLTANGTLDVPTAVVMGLLRRTAILSRGARGDAVRAVQQQLVTLGLSIRGGVDGVFGSATASTLKQFQRSRGLVATGSVDAGTAAILANAVAALTPVATPTTVTPVPPTPAPTAPPTAPPPTSPTLPPTTQPGPAAALVLDGHGSGHGYGLSQWGAYGYAVNFGWSATQILDHYYNGTVSGSVPIDTTITVRLQNLDDAQTAVVNAKGLLVVDGVNAGPWKSVLVRETAPSQYSVWARNDSQVCPDATGDPLATGWTLVAAAFGPSVNIRSQADIATTSFSDLVAVCEPTTGSIRSYRGTIRATNGTAGENRTVNELPIEHYLRAVIAKEMSPSWANAGGGRGAQALQAQAVAARSYALASNRYSYAKTCDLVCQFYRGAAYRTSVGGSYIQVEYPSTDAAVAATAGVVRRVGTASGAIALTMFAASTGGWTRSGSGSLMPFQAVVDEGDATAGNPNHSWTTTLAGTAISAKYPSIGTYMSITILSREGNGEWGGWVTSLRVNGTAGSVTVSGDSFRSSFGLQSAWFNPR